MTPSLTRQLLDAVLDEHPSGDHTVFALVLLPLLPVTLLVDAVLSYVHARKTAAVLGQRTATCPRGDTVGLIGDYTCAECGLTAHDVHAFSRCSCGAIAAAAQCACGLHVRNPLYDPEEE